MTASVIVAAEGDVGDVAVGREGDAGGERMAGQFDALEWFAARRFRRAFAIRMLSGPLRVVSLAHNSRSPGRKAMPV